MFIYFFSITAREKKRGNDDRESKSEADEETMRASYQIANEDI